MGIFREVFSKGCAVQLLLSGGLLASCSEPPPAEDRTPEPIPQVQAQPDHPSPSVRLRGHWVMDLARVPDTALTPDFKKLKQQGQAANVNIEYTFTDTEFILEKTGKGGHMVRRWYYEVVREVDDRLELERQDEGGAKKKIGATVRGDTLLLGTGQGTVPLFRKKG